MNYLVRISLLLFACISLLSCNNDDETVQQQFIANSLVFNYNDKVFSPDQLNDNECQLNLKYIFGGIITSNAAGEIPTFDITAVHTNPDLGTEIIFDTRIVADKDTDTYAVTGAFSSITESNIRITIKQNDGSNKTFINSTTEEQFFVEVQNINYVENSAIPKIRGKFWGVLYNQDDTTETLTINNGEFVFRKTLLSDFNHCDTEEFIFTE